MHEEDCVRLARGQVLVPGSRAVRFDDRRGIEAGALELLGQRRRERSEELRTPHRDLDGLSVLGPHIVGVLGVAGCLHVLSDEVQVALVAVVLVDDLLQLARQPTFLHVGRERHDDGVVGAVVAQR